MHWATWDRSGEHEVSCGQQWSALAFPKKALFCRVCRSVCGRNWGWAELLRLVERNQDWALVRTKGIKKKAVGPLQRPEKRNLWGFRGMHERLYHTLINHTFLLVGGEVTPLLGSPFESPSLSVTHPLALWWGRSLSRGAGVGPCSPGGWHQWKQQWCVGVREAQADLWLPSGWRLWFPSGWCSLRSEQIPCPPWGLPRPPLLRSCPSLHSYRPNPRALS